MELKLVCLIEKYHSTCNICHVQLSVIFDFFGNNCSQRVTKTGWLLQIVQKCYFMFKKVVIWRVFYDLFMLITLFILPTQTCCICYTVNFGCLLMQHVTFQIYYCTVFIINACKKNLLQRIKSTQGSTVVNELIVLSLYCSNL